MFEDERSYLAGVENVPKKSLKIARNGSKSKSDCLTCRAVAVD